MAYVCALSATEVDVKFAATMVIVLFVTSTASGFASGPSGSLNGRIVDKQTGFPVPGATIAMINSKRGTIAKNDGTFTLLKVPDGAIRLRVSSVGYVTDTLEIAESEVSTFITIALDLDIRSAEQINVYGESGRGQARALGQQKTGANITNIVSADQIGRFPDQNVGDAMKRIPGIAVQYDQGEARFGLIRGTPGQFNSVMINGERIPSAEAEARQVQLDLVPADMVRSIEVNKTLTPDMDADAIGGSVNLVTRDASLTDRISATLGSGLNLLSGRPMVNGAFVASTRLLDGKLGVVASGSYFDHILGSDNIEGLWTEGDNGVFLEEFEVRQYQVRRVRRSISAGLDYRFDASNVIRLSTIYNHRDDWENRFRLRYIFDENSDETQIRRQTKGGISGDPTGATRLEDQRTYNVSLAGEHLLFDALRMTWSGTIARASEDRPNERYMSYRTRSATTTRNTADPSQPIVDVTSGSDLSTYELHELTEEFGSTEDVDRNGRIDLSLPWLTGEFSNTVKVGGRFRSKSKNRRNRFFEYEPTDNNQGIQTMTNEPLVDISKDNYLAGPYRIGRFVDQNALGGIDLNNSSLFEQTDLLEEYAAGNFEATERIVGGYVMVDQHIGDKLSAIVGVRIENTSNDYAGAQYDIVEETVVPTGNTSQYTNILPSVNLRYAATDDLILRGAWTNGIARPNYFDLVPYRIVNRDDSELEEGNASLRPTTSMNFDLMAEYYIEPVGIISAGVFTKSLKDFIFGYTRVDYVDPVSGQTFRRYSRPENGAAASLFGAEVAVQRQLDFLPGALAGIGVYLNYTYTTSSVTGVEGREGEDLPLTGNPNHTFNASLSYEWAGFTFRVAANYTSSYIDEFGDDAFNDRYYDNQLFLDANASYAITSNIRIFVDANNLTNQPLRYFQGVSNRVAQAEFYNARFQAGVKFDL